MNLTCFCLYSLSIFSSRHNASESLSLLLRSLCLQWLLHHLSPSPLPKYLSEQSHNSSPAAVFTPIFIPLNSKIPDTYSKVFARPGYCRGRVGTMELRFMTLSQLVVLYGVDGKVFNGRGDRGAVSSSGGIRITRHVCQFLRERWWYIYGWNVKVMFNCTCAKFCYKLGHGN